MKNYGNIIPSDAGEQNTVPSFQKTLITLSNKLRKKEFKQIYSNIPFCDNEWKCETFNYRVNVVQFRYNEQKN